MEGGRGKQKWTVKWPGKALVRKKHWSKDLKMLREGGEGVWGKSIQAEGTAFAKSLEQERAWCVRGAARGLCGWN